MSLPIERLDHLQISKDSSFWRNRKML